MNNNSGTSFRIPNLPMGKMVDENGFATDEEATFRQSLITLLQQLMGNEGLVAPIQNETNMTTIQNNTNTTPGANASTYTCQYGTNMYNSTNNGYMVAVNNGSDAPVFQQAVLSAGTQASAGSLMNYSQVTINGVQYAIPLHALS